MKSKYANSSSLEQVKLKSKHRDISSIEKKDIFRQKKINVHKQFVTRTKINVKPRLYKLQQIKLETKQKGKREQKYISFKEQVELKYRDSVRNHEKKRMLTF